MSEGSAGSSPKPRNHRSGSHPLGSLTQAEQAICGRLILRQLDRAPRIEQELKKYGPEGAVRLCSARALGVYEIALVVVALTLIASGAGLAGWLFVILFWLVAVLGITRLISAAKAGRRWRSADSARSP